ncbi:MAG TPA: exopolyphosphatase [Nitrospirae bacterium]|nr:exopolyphosphatase [Nitrospirota bacterium]
MRLVTRGDLDGLVSALLISEMEQVDGLALIHPQDITDKKFAVTPNDILANLPYDPACGIWFDHHEHTILPEGKHYRGRHAIEPSVARVIFDHYASEKLQKYSALVSETDRFDSADLSREDILDPSGAILLGFLIDPRTGMGRDFKSFFMSLMERVKKMDVDSLMTEPDILDRVAIYRENQAAFQEILLANSKVEGNVVITDIRNLESPPIGNRFLVYTMFPHCNVSVRVQWGPGRKFVAINIGHSILDRSCQVDAGQLCREFGGGGHKGAGACVLEPETADLELQEIIERLIDHAS